jgi:hypothetical protein
LNSESSGDRHAFLGLETPRIRRFTIRWICPLIRGFGREWAIGRLGAAKEFPIGAARFDLSGTFVIVSCLDADFRTLPQGKLPVFSGRIE